MNPDWLALEKKVSAELKSYSISISEVNELFDSFREKNKIVETLFWYQKIDALEPFLSKGIQDKQLTKIAKWCGSLGDLLAGSNAASMHDLHAADDDEFDQMVGKRVEEERYMNVIIPPALKKEDLFRISTTLTALSEFRRGLFKENQKARKGNRKLETNLRRHPAVTKLLYELTIFINKKINPHHLGKFKDGGSEKRILDDSYRLASQLTQIFFRLPYQISVAQARAQIQHLIKKLYK